MRKLTSAITATLFALAFSLGAQTASQQTFYYLCAIPGPANLYRADTQGGTGQLVRSVAKAVELVLADYDKGKLVVASPTTTPHIFAVIDMNAPEKDHSASIDYNPEETLPDAVYLMEIPQQGLWLAMPLGGMFKTPPVAASGLTAVSLEAENASVATLPFTALAGVHVSGLVGGALFQRLVEVRGDPLHILLGDPVGHDIGVPRPPYLGSSANPFGEGYQLVAANDSVVLLMPFLPEPVAKDVIDICDRGSHAWRRATLPFTVSAVRAFGPWVTGISTEPRGGPGYGAGRTSFNSSEFAAMRKSPGQEKRASELFDGRHSIDEMFDGSSNYFPGDLVVLNARTDRRLTIHTGEGDSEVVLATDDAAYYRVNDAIFRADLVSGKLSPGTKIAQGPNVPQAHWAFLGPPAN